LVRVARSKRVPHAGRIASTAAAALPSCQLTVGETGAPVAASSSVVEVRWLVMATHSTSRPVPPGGGEGLAEDVRRRIDDRDGVLLHLEPRGRLDAEPARRLGDDGPVVGEDHGPRAGRPLVQDGDVSHDAPSRGDEAGPFRPGSCRVAGVTADPRVIYSITI
jgi:hypothetical protein